MLIVHASLHASGTRRAGTVHIYGKVLDAATHKAVDYASVSILLADRDSLITGMLSETNGDFSFDNIPSGSYRIKVSFMGYVNYEKAFTAGSSMPDLDLGNIAMSASSKKLGEVTVTGDKAAMTMSVDRKVFNVDKDISSRGG